MIPWNKGLKDYNTGPRDQKWKDSISAGLKKTYDKRGRKSTVHSLMRKSREYLEWRSLVFKRDSYKCQGCGRGGGPGRGGGCCGSGSGPDAGKAVPITSRS